VTISVFLLDDHESDEEALFGAIYVSSLLHKLGLTRRTEAAVYAERRRTERINDRR
jgi:hypothetical protein